MAKAAITEQYLTDIADAIRSKTGMSSATYYPSEMAPAIMTISGSGGITPSGTININTNGTHNVTTYASANVSVPNSYSAGDEGKVVSNGTLVAQTSAIYNTNNTYDTTLINSVTVNVSGGGSNTDFIVTLLWDDDYFGVNEGALIPNKTFSEIQTAYNSELSIITFCEGEGVPFFGFYDNTTPCFIYGYFLQEQNYYLLYAYQLDSNGIEILVNGHPFYNTENVTVTSSDVLNGVDFYGADGWGEGTILTKTSSDITTNGNVVTIPNGYYASNVTKTLPMGTYTLGSTSNYYTQNNQRKWRYSPGLEVDPAGWMAGEYYGNDVVFNAIPTNTTITPTTSSQTIGGANYMMEEAVTVAAMPTGSATGPSSLSGSSATVTTGTNTITLTKTGVTTTPTVSAGYVSAATASTASVSLTASVTTKAAATITPTTTNQTIASGTYLTGTQTIAGDANLVAGNIKKDVTIFGTTGTYEGSGGGGGSSMVVATTTKTLTSAASSISFTGLSGEPTSFVITSLADQSTGGTKSVAVAYDGTNLFGMNVTTQAENDTGFSKSYLNGTLTVIATSATFEANEYKLVYTYGGSSSDIHTADVQVGSGATSITFTSLSGKPAYFSCVFKSSFSTSSGYQRVIDVVNDGTNTYGHAFDSSAKAQTSWSYSYSGGSLTISSTGTNNGGYFHQPGYYQLTYAVDPNALNLQEKTGIGATTSSQTITADSGYDGLESVQINPVSQTNLTAANIKSGTTISISNGSTNLWSVTGTYSGGGTSRLDLITTKSLGTISTSSTSEASINQSIVINKTDYDDYEIIVVITSVDSVVSNRHVATLGIVTVYGDSDASSKNSAYQPSVKTNYRHNGTKLVSRANNTVYGIYAKGSQSNSKLTLAFYQKYNSTYTGTINGSYTARVYGLKLLDLIS